MEKSHHNSIKNFHIPRWKELPSIELYLDQVVKLVNNCLTPYINPTSNPNSKDDSDILTKTMINNYVKNNLIDAPVKKQYSRVQLAKLFVICVLKQVYSMQDIAMLIDTALASYRIEIAYNQFCRLFEQALICTYSKVDFIDRSTGYDDLYLLKSVLLSCSYKIYSKNIITEQKND